MCRGDFYIQHDKTAQHYDADENVKKKLYEDILVNGNIECSLVFVLTVNKDECTKGDGHCPYIGQTTLVR